MSTALNSFASSTLTEVSLPLPSLLVGSPLPTFLPSPPRGWIKREREGGGGRRRKREKERERGGKKGEREKGGRERKTEGGREGEMEREREVGGGAGSEVMCWDFQDTSAPLKSSS